MTAELQLAQEAQRVLNRAYFWMDFLSLAQAVSIVVAAVFTVLFFWKLAQFMRQRRREQLSPRATPSLDGLANASG
jgi:hypothetical protein